MTNKKIDINQRIPLDTLYAVLESYLDDNYSDEYIIEQLRLHFDGENRLKKSLRIVKKIVSNNPLSDFILSNKEQVKVAIKKKTDRNLILIALLSSSFVFSYDVISILGKLFKVQNAVNREALTREASRIYGGNRALPNAIDSVIPMYLEAELFTRPQPGLYQWESGLTATTEITKQIYYESFKVVNSTDEVLDFHLSDPYFLFVEGL
ncbi:hypothetical protein [Maribellus mangrovi]|uniref:hypothetical protein n=1 Tax=Maribellus mangrovi TaxID=3133146 RepID=UPI0030EC3D6A